MHACVRGLFGDLSLGCFRLEDSELLEVFESYDAASVLRHVWDTPGAYPRSPTRPRTCGTYMHCQVGSKLLQ